MTVTAAELASDPVRILDCAIQNGEAIQIERDGRTIAQIVPSIGVSKKELLQVLQKVSWSPAESQELKNAMDAASEVFGYAGGD